VSKDEHDGEMTVREELERLHGASYGWALSCCSGRRREAEDVLHTAYVKVLDGRARYDGKSSFRTWLFSVIRNTAIDLRRLGWLRERLLARWYRDRAAHAIMPGTDESLHGEDHTRRIRAAIERLPRRQREILHLVFYQDLSIAEAAQVLGISVGSGRTHFARGKASLRASLGQHEPP
jgi:RNA polymerase sigma factor (sigma-70 family)